MAFQKLTIKIFASFTILVVLNGLLLAQTPLASAQSSSQSIQADRKEPAQKLFRAAKRYHDGDGVRQNFKQARELYLKAAALGNSNAQLNLGYMYFVGQGVAVNYQTAIAWYSKAANLGNKDARTNLAMMYEHGVGVPKNPKMAQKWRQANLRPQLQDPKPLPSRTVDEAQAKAPQTQIIAPKKPLPKPLDTKPSETKPLETKPLETHKAKAAQTPPPTPMPAAATASSAPKIAAPIIDAVIPSTEIPTQPIPVNIPTPNISTPTAVPNVSLPKTDIKLKNPAGLHTVTSPIWVGHIIIGGLILSALGMTIWFLSELISILKRRRKIIFVNAFLDKNLDTMRLLYLKRTQKNRAMLTANDQWSVAVCTALILFALNYSGKNLSIEKEAKIIKKQLRQSPQKARESLFPLLTYLQPKIYASIRTIDNHHASPVSQQKQALMRPTMGSSKASAVRRQNPKPDLQLIRN